MEKAMTPLISRGRLPLCIGFVFAATLVAGVPLLDAAPGRGDRPARPERPAGPATRPATAAAMDERVAAQLDRTVPDADFAEITFEDALFWLREASKLNLVVDWAALGEAGVDPKTEISFRAKGVKVGAALKDVTRAAGDAKDPVTYGVIGPVVFVSTAKGVTAAAKSAAAAEAKVKGARFGAGQAQPVLAEINFPGIALYNAVDFLSDVSGHRIAVDWKELKAAGVDKATPVHLIAKDVPFSVALHLVVVTSTGGKADFTVINGQIVVTSAAAVAKPPAREPGL
jgi:hypothetical protein